MLKRITKLLDAWESLMRSEQKAFELAIEKQENCKKLEIFKLKSKIKVLENGNLQPEDFEELRYINEALRLLVWGKLNVKS